MTLSGMSTPPSVLLALPVAALLGLGACGGPTTSERLGLSPPDTVEDLDLDRYLGSWYEIASYPQWFQEGCEATTAQYSLREDELLDVLNRCIVEGELIEAQGLARPVDLDRGKLEVSFFGPFWGDYWVLDLGEANGSSAPYTHALVGAPSRDALWILSRTPSLDDDTLDAIVERIEELQFSPDRLQVTEQPVDEG